MPLTSKMAIVSDIHGNLEALTAVLEDIKRQNIDTIYSLGDTVGYGPNPKECLQIARTRFKLYLQGNHENAVVNEPTGFNAYAAAAAHWTKNQLSPEDIEYLAALSKYRLENDTVFVHGSIKNPLWDYVTVYNQMGLSNYYDLVKTLKSEFQPFNICFVGHNHTPFLGTEVGFIHPHEKASEFQVGGEKLYISIGSVGQPRDGDRRACYVTFDGETVTYHRLEYDIILTASKIFESGLPHFLGNRLLEGR